MNRILVGIIFSLFITTGYIAFLVYDRQQELQKLTHYTESWSVAQLVSEYYRFESWIGLYATETDDVTVDQVRMRLEIMLSQNDLLKEGGLGRYINSEKAHQTLALRLEKILNYLDGHLEKMSRSELKLYLKNMHSLDAPLSQLSSTALTKDVNTINETNLKIQVLYYIYSALSLLLVILSFILGFLIIYQNKNILKAHTQVKTLAEELQLSKETLQIQNTKLEYDVYHDSLTGMKNRLFFWDDLNKLNLQAEEKHISVTVMLFDLDRFKEVNDTYGHDAGDLLLREVSTRLNALSRFSETFYRLGGDEFAFLSSGLTEAAAVSRAREISDSISKPYTINNQLIKIATCVGIVLSDNERRSDYLYKFADLALYEAKKEGSQQIKVFRQRMLQKLQESRTLENDMARAIENDEFIVYYQPIVNSVSKEIYGYEALIRWMHPVKGMLSPDSFIFAAEKTGMINEIGKTVLKLACREAVSWAVPARISVNVSPVQLGSKSFINTVQSVLAETGLPANRLELEVTESSLFSDRNNPIAILKKLRSLGVRISIDDFGTGYSSLSRLSELNFDKIKIDKSFVNPISTQEDALNIVKLITGMAKSLNMGVIAEGVETEEQLERLQALGCELVQGYLFSKPQPQVDSKIKSGQE
ncbi:bifunctional diguanylate cyclase/phosphodiesterase [Enterobacter hormaechei subsp. xiangfangensis]|uniref:putative bifunctional diguanylate cyclase/phosphodiesterase n=1 Tax=Enterobacter hormaechei TaxID=158836 RepID=UPI000F82F4D0|nr:bifunctional diguanylate cyclase/phosphodiesterase [Enterobacter hormaechei]RTM41429.1 bifunctional diguanylate cyclase/phosphodiesterase [Enterobacter hormaechei subsp. xiangfangensis]RTM72587.1 bifunctional diguanylate cyclase/phosphodiesterase [Enterobacter hormaechei subsp. xiangfangensis]HDT2961751.1 bifunctional diguanylate cyclase/phosphodiesterase [Enterobacter hormaechei subsp. steigerwaltii]HDT2963810.1 bifunctional diguanylate cyclase/phosphodiesterase [Enterobacter hormaechei sub